MTATLRGGDALSRFLADLPGNLEAKVLRGALLAGAEVIADAARANCRSDEVRSTIKTSSSAREKGIITAKVQTKGDGAYIAPWLEHGTDPHFISVDSAQSGGRTVKRVNIEHSRGSLVIGGNFVGKTVHHPGASPYPFMRPALDQNEDAAIAAIGAHIRAHLTKDGLEGPAPATEPDE